MLSVCRIFREVYRLTVIVRDVTNGGGAFNGIRLVSPITCLSCGTHKQLKAHGVVAVRSVDKQSGFSWKTKTHPPI